MNNMYYIETIGIIFSFVALMLFAIQKFSGQLQKIAGGKVKDVARSITDTPVKGFFTGFFSTALLQSSSTTTVLTVGLVNAGIITFYQSIGVVLGANVGTALSSQLIAYNVTHIAPLIVISGFLMFKIKNRYQIYGKSVFYFGLLFFSISMISIVVEPLTHDPNMISIFSKIDGLGISLLLGIVAAVILQSSTVVSALVIILGVSGFIDLREAIGIIIGSDIGTTSTALLAAWELDLAAKRVAVSHFLFNVIWGITLIPFLFVFDGWTLQTTQNIGIEIANIRFLCNLIPAIVFLFFTKKFAWLVEVLVK